MPEPFLGSVWVAVDSGDRLVSSLPEFAAAVATYLVTKRTAPAAELLLSAPPAVCFPPAAPGQLDAVAGSELRGGRVNGGNPSADPRVHVCYIRCEAVGQTVTNHQNGPGKHAESRRRASGEW